MCKEIEDYCKELGIPKISIEELIDSHRNMRIKIKHFNDDYNKKVEEGYNRGLELAKQSKDDFITQMKSMTIQELCSMLNEGV